MNEQLYHYRAIVTGVYDGDSITVDIDLGFNSWLLKQKVRLYGINTPEIRGSERVAGLAAKSILSKLILGEEVIMVSHKDRSGKYGRWLATIHLEMNDKDTDQTKWININELLIENNHATPYLP